MSTSDRQLAVVTGASSGIGYELSRCCARHGYDLVIAADDSAIQAVVAELQALGAVVESVQADLIYLTHRIGREMLNRGQERILFTGSIAGFMPGTFQAVYNGTKAFVDSFSYALRNELKDTGVTVTCLMPGVTDTNFFERADLMDTKIGQEENKADPAEVAKIGFEAMVNGEAGVVAGAKNKLQVAAAHSSLTPCWRNQHRKKAEPGSESGIDSYWRGSNGRGLGFTSLVELHRCLGAGQTGMKWRSFSLASAAASPSQRDAPRA